MKKHVVLLLSALIFQGMNGVIFVNKTGKQVLVDIEPKAFNYLGSEWRPTYQIRFRLAGSDDAMYGFYDGSIRNLRIGVHDEKIFNEKKAHVFLGLPTFYNFPSDLTDWLFAHRLFEIPITEKDGKPVVELQEIMAKEIAKKTKEAVPQLPDPLTRIIGEYAVPDLSEKAKQ